jgi:transposase
MHAPRLKKWAAIIDHRDFIRRRACNPQLNHALFYLPPYSPELNLIEIVWKQAKYHWRRFVTWTKETIDAEIAKLLDAYGSKFQIDFS